MKFTYLDIVALRDKAVQRFVEYPYRLRLPGMAVDLTDSDKRVLAHLEASVEILNRLGVVDYEKFQQVWQIPFTEVQEVINEQTYGATLTPQKK